MILQPPGLRVLECMPGFHSQGEPAARHVRFARATFLVAGIWGLLVLVPQYFAERIVSGSQNAGLPHPEFFYGFVGVGISWQLAFLLISRDPPRFRPLMLAAIVEKLSFGLAVIVLTVYGRVEPAVLAFAFVDLVLCVLFALSYQLLGRPGHAQFTQPPRLPA